MKSMMADLVFVVNASAIASFLPAPKLDILQTKYQFPNESWVENLAVRSNGNVLVTLLSSPEVWEIDPSKKEPAELVYHFPEALSALGVAELQSDIFVVAVGNITLPAIASQPGSYSAWAIDMRYQPRHSRKQQRTHPPRVSKIADLPQAHFLNGVSKIPSAPHTVLLADSAQGVIYALDTETGASRTWLEDPAFKPNSSIPVKSGINGLHVQGGYLYFTNTFSPSARPRSHRRSVRRACRSSRDDRWRTIMESQHRRPSRRLYL